MTHGRATEESTIYEHWTRMHLRRKWKRMCQLLENRKSPASYAEVPASRVRLGAGSSDKGSWVAIGTLITLLLGPSILAVLATYNVNQRNRPSEEELAADFFSHETTFDELVQRLDADRGAVGPERETPIDFAALSRLSKNAVRMDTYRGLLRQISVADFRYFPNSGKLILLPDRPASLQRPSKSYLYLPHAQPQPLVRHHGYYWRGPGVYILTGDRPLKGSWFIQYDTVMPVAFVPY
jgi:hypothetical protein